MLILKPAQLRALAEERRRDFEQRLLAALPGTAGQAPDLVRRAVALAPPAIDRERDIARFVDILLRHPAAWPDGVVAADGLRMLDHAYLPPERRLDDFERWASRQGDPR